MKFRTIFIVFNAVVAFSFVFLFIAPVAVIGLPRSAAFWALNWPLALGFIAVLAALNFFFLANRRLFSLLEREDWPALVAYLDAQIYQEGRLTARNARIQVNALLLLSDLSGIEKLESLLAERKPALLERIALPFALARLLSGDDAKAEAFLSRYAGSKKAEGGEWMDFDLAFCESRQGRHAEAASRFASLLGSRSLPIRGMAAWFAWHSAARLSGPEALALKDKAQAARAGLAKTKRSRWDREAAALREEIQGVVFGRLMDESAEWIYGNPADEAAVSPAPEGTK